MPENCQQNTDPLKLTRDGVNQDERLSQALKPSYAEVNERTPAHGMLFAKALSAYLNYYDDTNTLSGNWTPFFDNDISVRLANAAIQDIDDYKSHVKSSLDFLNNLDNETEESNLINNLSYIFSYAATLARQLDVLYKGLSFGDEPTPDWLTLKASLQNLIQSQLAPALLKLISYYKAGKALSVATNVAPVSELNILGVKALSLELNMANDFSKDWITDGSADWNTYFTAIAQDSSVYGNPAGSVFELTNHIATHNLFTATLDQFLKVYARIVSEAQSALEASFTNWDRHDPHYALFLSFLKLFEYARNEANTLTGRHLDFYYRDILRLKEKPSTPSNAHLIAELAKQAVSHQFKTGDLFIAGKDASGKDVLFANANDMIANQAKVTSLKSVYRHGIETVGTGVNADKQTDRLYASPVANSADGSGKAIDTEDKSWHPFFNKIYRDDALEKIDMPEAEVGFVITSHYFLMAEGDRTITLAITLAGNLEKLSSDFKDDIICRITVEKGWLEIPAVMFGPVSGSVMQLQIKLTGSDPATAPYLLKTHGYTFDTNLPVLMVKLRHHKDKLFIYSLFEGVEVQQVGITVNVLGLKTLSLSNDFGPVDSSKPFQPFGAQPVTGSALIIGSKEVFQKNLSSLTINNTWLEPPAPYGGTIPNVSFDFLNSGVWKPTTNTAAAVTSVSYPLSQSLQLPVRDEPDFNADESFTTEARHGFVRMKLNADFGQKAYMAYLLKYLRGDSDAITAPGSPPAGPFMTSLSLDYTASQTIILNSDNQENFTSRSARFYHLLPFGHAEQHILLSVSNKISLMPWFGFERNAAQKPGKAEFYIGLTGLKPPQNISMLFQVADGTANPLTLKPKPHLHWSYMRNNEWVAFKDNEVEDYTSGLLKSGIVVLAVPSDANETNKSLPSGQHWIRIAVTDGPDAVCRLLMVAAQALLATFSDKDNDPAFAATVLPAGTISKPAVQDAAIKKISQPSDSFGGRAAEAPTDFYTRISERLRHKDRAIALYDYEHIVLDAFPEIYRVKCLNHTQYEPTENSIGIYRELAPGHVTLVTIPDKQFHNQRNPLRPFTSLGILEEIAAYIKARVSCFVNLHVRNPQYEEVRVNFKLKLLDGFDEAFYTLQLKDAITRFLSPWAFTGEGSPVFGGKIYKSVLIDFVEEQPYVDYVTDFEMFHDIAGTPGTKDKNEIEGSMAVSILVSVPSAKHGISVIHPAADVIAADKCNCES